MNNTGKTQYRLAKDTGIPITTINGWFTGKTKCPRDKYLNIVAAYFKVSPAWLQYGDKAYAPTLHDKSLELAEKLERYIVKHPEDAGKIEQLINVITAEGLQKHSAYSKGQGTQRGRKTA